MKSSISLALAIASVFFLTPKPGHAYTLLDKENRIHIGSGFFWDGFSLTNDESSYSLPETSVLHLHAEWVSPRWWALFDRQKENHLSPSGYTPATIEATYTRLRLARRIESMKFEWLHGEAVPFVGYGADYLGADVAAPQTALSGHFLHGPVFGISHQIVVNEDLIIDSRISLLVPFFFSEKRATTGSYTTAQLFEFYTSAMYPISNRLGLSAGLQMTYDRILYRGSGDNGLTNGIQKRFSVGIPLELRYFF